MKFLRIAIISLSLLLTLGSGFSPVSAQPLSGFAVSKKTLLTAAPKVITPAPAPTYANMPAEGPYANEIVKLVPGRWMAGVKLKYQWYVDGRAVAGATGLSFKIPASKASVVRASVTGTRTGYKTLTKWSSTSGKIWTQTWKVTREGVASVSCPAPDYASHPYVISTYGYKNSGDNDVYTWDNSWLSKLNQSASGYTNYRINPAPPLTVSGTKASYVWSSAYASRFYIKESIPGSWNGRQVLGDGGSLENTIVRSWVNFRPTIRITCLGWINTL